MEFLANENIPWPSILYLRQKGYTVKSISEEFSGIPDEDVVRLAERESLTILTFDSDYGEILFKYLRPNPPSVIFFRFKGKSPNDAGKLLVDILKSQIKIEGYFTVIEENGIRQRKL